MNYLTRNGKQATSDLVNTICRYIKENADIAVIGLSGGADSTLVAILCTIALGKENVYGVSMPYGNTDVATFNKRSRSLAVTLGINHRVFNISNTVDSFVKDFEGIDICDSMSNLNTGNLRSRTRMMALYATACSVNENMICDEHQDRVRVIGTGNLSEDFIGYDTKGGDALADFFPIGELYKQEVYDLLDFFVEQKWINESHIDRTPSAGLWEGQTDEAELGHSYNEMAPAIEYLHNNTNFIEGEIPSNIKEIAKPVLSFVRERHLANRHKHLAPPVCPVRIINQCIETNYRGSTAPLFTPT